MAEQRRLRRVRGGRFVDVEIEKQAPMLFGGGKGREVEPVEENGFHIGESGLGDVADAAADVKDGRFYPLAKTLPQQLRDGSVLVAIPHLEIDDVFLR